MCLQCSEIPVWVFFKPCTKSRQHVVLITAVLVISFLPEMWSTSPWEALLLPLPWLPPVTLGAGLFSLYLTLANKTVLSPHQVTGKAREPWYLDQSPLHCPTSTTTLRRQNRLPPWKESHIITLPLVSTRALSPACALVHHPMLLMLQPWNSTYFCGQVPTCTSCVVGDLHNV